MTNNPVPDNEKLDFKRILPVFVIVLVDLLGLTIIIPLLPLYAASFGADPFTIGLIGAVYPTMQLIAGPYLGSLSDRFGRKPVLVFSQIGTFVGFIILAFANSIPLLLISRVIDGLSGANIVAAQAAIADMTTPKTRTQGLGLIGAAFGLGFTLGPALAGISLALSGNNYHVPAFLAAGCSLASIILTSVWFKESNPAETRAARQQSEQRKGENWASRFVRVMRHPAIAAMLIMMLLQQMVFGGFENLIPLFNLSRLGMNASGSSGLFVFIGIVVVLVQGYYIGRWSRRFGERKLVLAGFILLGFGLVFSALTPQQPVSWYSREAMINELNHNESGTVTIAVELPDDTNTGMIGFVWLLVALIPTAIGGSILSPSLNSLITQQADPAEIGAVLGVSASMVSLANAVTPLVGGGLFQWLGSSAPFLIGGIAMFLLYILALRIVPQPASKEPVVAPAAA